MKAHKYWSLGALACMAGCFYTGYKKLMQAHKYFACGSLICMGMAIYSGHKIAPKKKKAEKPEKQEHTPSPQQARAFLNFRGSFYFRHKLYVKNFHHQPHPAFQAFLKGGLFPGAAHRPLPVQTFTLFPSVNPQLLRVLAIPAFFNFVREW